MNKNVTTNPKGFTLIELLVVITIIGILAGITFKGANFLFSAQDEKKAESEIEALKLALNQYKAECGDYPTINPDSVLSGNSEKNAILLNALIGITDRFGDELKSDEIRRSFLPNDTFSFGFSENNTDFKSVYMQGAGIDLVFVDEEGKEQRKQVVIIDPWERPYVYEYPRRDGHIGYLLFSKGKDGQASIFDKELTSTPNKEPMDEDNIPNTEPGKW